MFVALCLINLALIAIFNTVPVIPSFVKAISATLGFLLIPIQIGDMALAMLRLSEYRRRLPLTEHLVASWSMGISFTAIVSLLSLQIEEFVSFRFTLLLPYLLVIVSTMFVYFNRVLEEKLEFFIEERGKFIKKMIVLSLVNLIPLAYVRSHSQYPYQIMVDGFIIGLRAKQFLLGRYRFHEYVSFPILVSYLSGLYKVSALELLWFMPICLYIILSISVYALARQLTDNNKIAAFSSILSTWFIGGGMVCEIHSFLPKNVLYVSFPLALFLVNRILMKYEEGPSKLTKLLVLLVSIYLISSPTIYSSVISRLEWVKLLMPFYYLTEPAVQRAEVRAYTQVLFSVILISLIFYITYVRKRNVKLYMNYVTIFLLVSSLYLVHYIIGFMFAFMLLIYIFMYKMLTGKRAVLHPIYALVLLSILLIIIVEIFGLRVNPVIKNYVSLIERVPWTISKIYQYHYSYHPSILWRIFSTTYGVYGLILYFVGIYSITKAGSIKERLLTHSALFSLLVLFFFLLPYPYSYRMLTYLTPFVSIFSTIALIKLFGIIWDGEPILIMAVKLFKKRKELSMDLRILGIVVLLILTISTAYDNYLAYTKSLYMTKHGISTFTDVDLFIAEYLKNEYNENLLIITDPMTLKIISSLTGYDFTIEGRVFTETATYPIYQVKEEDMKLIIACLNYTKLNELLKLYSEYFNVQPKSVKVIIIVNNRTTHWIRRGKSGIMKTFIKFSGLQKLVEEAKIIVNISGHYYVFEVQRHSNGPSSFASTSDEEFQGNNSVMNLEAIEGLSIEDIWKFKLKDKTRDNFYLLSQTKNSDSVLLIINRIGGGMLYA